MRTYREWAINRWDRSPHPPSPWDGVPLTLCSLRAGFPTRPPRLSKLVLFLTTLFLLAASPFDRGSSIWILRKSWRAQSSCHFVRLHSYNNHPVVLHSYPFSHPSLCFSPVQNPAVMWRWRPTGAPDFTWATSGIKQSWESWVGRNIRYDYQLLVGLVTRVRLG